MSFISARTPSVSYQNPAVSSAQRAPAHPVGPASLRLLQKSDDEPFFPSCYRVTVLRSSCGWSPFLFTAPWVAVHGSELLQRGAK